MTKKLKEIATAWKNVISKNDEVELIAADRMDTCKQCPFKKEMLGVAVCGLCHCPLVAKTRSPLNSCDRGAWKR
jgi:hypothetical protein